ncbi:NAD(P)-binding protein [Choiromyces venosus 120613-1]|uniref:NAD(P)-binding protein n=1 Tax=Choiromyces venosus 120613-1 TaxID=1336337 RepID=A0A3N4IX65_9PEZI|nr:NAD(P)-binding protein [Choiromyces venosus 120613-1]
MTSLKGKKVLVTGGSRGLGAATAHAFAKEGAHVMVNYVSDETSATNVALEISEKYGIRAGIAQGDVGVEENCIRIVNKCIAVLGGIDVIVSNAGWTRISKFGDLNALSEADWDKCWAVNVKANLFLLRAASETFNANPDGGSLLISSSVAGLAPGGSAMAYSVTKAAGLHLMRCLAQSQGPKIRVNAVLPGLLLTDWGNKFGQERIEETKGRAALKDCPTVEECADAFVLMAKSKNMTGASLKIDAGLLP